MLKGKKMLRFKLENLHRQRIKLSPQQRLELRVEFHGLAKSRGAKVEGKL